MATGNITRLEGVWPETHERAVRDSAGVNLETKLANINEEFSQLEHKVGDFPFTETRVTNLAWASGNISKTNGSVLTNSNYEYVTVPLGDADAIRFPGNAYANVNDWSGGYAFYDENDSCIASYSYDASGTGTNFVKEYIVQIPSGAATFKTACRVDNSQYTVVKKADFYCYLQYGTTLSALLTDVSQTVDEMEKATIGTVTLRRGAVTISSQYIVVSASTNRLFSARYINIEDVREIGIGDGYLFNVLYFDSTLKKIGESGYVESFKQADASTAKFVLITIKKTDDSNFADGDTGGFFIVYAREIAENLEDISCCGVSLKSLFIDSNMVENGDLLGGTDGWGGSNAVNIAYDSESYGISKSWYADSAYSRIYRSLNLKEGHRYLVACETRTTGVNSTITSSSNNVLDYNGGSLQNNRAMGIVLASKPFGISHTSKAGYEIVVGFLDIPIETSAGTVVAKNYNLGNGGVNNMLFGYSRNAVCVDITDASFTRIPTRKDLFNAFRKYCEYLKCQPVSAVNLAFGIDTKQVFNDSDAKRAFMSEMNTIAGELGCMQTALYNPSGVYYSAHLTTCKDYIKIGAAALSENSFLRIINTHSMDVPVVHADGTSGFIVPTEVAEYSGASGEASEVLVSSYDIVSAKTGTWNGSTTESKTQALVMVVRSKATGKFIVGYIHNTGANYSSTWDNNKYNYMKNLFDKVEDNSITLSLGTTTEWSAGYIPESTQWAKYVDFGTVKNSDTTQFPPASTTKYLTCMLALQHLKETEIVEYDIFDYSTGSGASITAGDKFTVRDAVYLCMALSSNSLANMLARYTGQRLMEESNF